MYLAIYILLVISISCLSVTIGNFLTLSDTQERELDREKIEYLTGENARLEFEKKSSVNESSSLETELSVARSKINSERFAVSSFQCSCWLF